jgi:serine/threonine protein kinase
LKPENILVNKLKKQMKILQIGDFGISKKTTIPQTTFTNAFSTTIAYKAPEAMKG